MQLKHFKPGPIIERYASTYDIPVAEVLAWMEGYVDGPWPDGLSVEATAPERKASIQSYVRRNCSHA